MFDIGASELLLIIVVAIVVIGPKDMPLALRTAGRWIGKMRRVSNHFRSGLDAMIREAEMEEMEKEWRDQNAAILAKHPAGPEMEPLAGTAESRGLGMQAPQTAGTDADADADADAGVNAAGPRTADAAAQPAWAPHDTRPNAIMDPEPPAATPGGQAQRPDRADAADPTAMDRATHRAAAEPIEAAERPPGDAAAPGPQGATPRPETGAEPRLPFADRRTGG